MAMAHGVPVVTVDYGLEVHHVEDGVNGLIFPMDDSHSLANKLRVLLDSDELMREIGNNGITTIRDQVNISKMAEGFRMALYGIANQ